jgi:hypothetical protein
MWRCDGIIDYIIWEMMSSIKMKINHSFQTNSLLITTSHGHHFPDDVIDNPIISTPGGEEIGLITTPSGK